MLALTGCEEAPAQRAVGTLERLEIDVERMTIRSPRTGTIDALPF